MRLDGSDGEEEGGGDLLVGAPLGRQRGNAPLPLGRFLRRGPASTDALERVLGRRQPEACTQLAQHAECLLERVSRRSPLQRQTTDLAEREKAASTLERIRRGFILRQGHREGAKRLLSISTRCREESSAPQRADACPAVRPGSEILVG